MICYHCGCNLTAHSFCTNCGVDVGLYKKIMAVSNFYYNEGLEKAGVRDLSGAIVSLRQSLKFNKNNIDALVIDVRDNPGGHIEQTRDILSEFFPRGKVLYRIQTKDSIKKVYSINNKNI